MSLYISLLCGGVYKVTENPNLMFLFIHVFFTQNKADFIWLVNITFVCFVFKTGAN